MAAKQKNALKDKLTVELRFPKYVGFSDYYLATPITVQIKNEAAEAVTLNVTAESGTVCLRLTKHRRKSLSKVRWNSTRKFFLRSFLRRTTNCGCALRRS